MGRFLTMGAAVICYAAFFAAFLYLIGFAAALPLLPTHVDKGLEGGPIQAVAIDLGLIALFGLQHSVMARKGFKQAAARIIPPPLERAFYCLATALVLGLLFFAWHPIDGSVWSITNPVGRMVMWALFIMGWGVLLTTTFLLNHFELFGLAQAWRHLRGQSAAPMQFRTPLFYKMVRHPLYFGFFFGLWATPDMTYSHLLLAAGLTVYIMIGIVYEERDLVAEFGDRYREYQRSTGAFLPGIGRKS